MSAVKAHLLHNTQKRMGALFTPNQVLGRIRTIGCVAVEITQRCNLDCTLCYLSEHSQHVRDIPIAEVFKRLDAVVTHYGVGTDVQITGGDPTLRKHSELIEIVRYASNIGLYPALFTNGIAASRPLLQKLANAGLSDVAFHVDTTQRRKGFTSEAALNEIRKDYIERARGLGLMVIFNTTIHKENFSEIPTLIQFFAEHADVIGLASFQLQAETGRGEWRSRDVIINQQTVQVQLEQGVGRTLPWGAVKVGHGDCHNYMPAVVANGKLFPVAHKAEFIGAFLRDFSGVSWNRRQALHKNIHAFLAELIKRPRWWPRLIRYGLTQLRMMGKDLIRARGHVHKLTLFVQNFMDAEHLEEDRINACSFMVMTADGPISMCKHNANRDEFILKPINIVRDDGSVQHFEPLQAKNPSRKQATTEYRDTIPVKLI